MDTGFKNAFEYKVIYVFTIEDELHKGLVKIGDATLHTSTPVDQLTPGCRELNQASLKELNHILTLQELHRKFCILK